MLLRYTVQTEAFSIYNPIYTALILIALLEYILFILYLLYLFFPEGYYLKFFFEFFINSTAFYIIMLSFSLQCRICIINFLLIMLECNAVVYVKEEDIGTFLYNCMPVEAESVTEKCED
jgi:hypothetical protein